jgi:hypothetical protein
VSAGPPSAGRNEWGRSDFDVIYRVTTLRLADVEETARRTLSRI